MQNEKRTRKGDLFSRFRPRLSKQEALDQDRRWLVLRNKTRRRIMDLLSQYGGLLCVTEIAEVLEESPSVISSHMALLRAVQLVTSTKFKSAVYYELNRDQLQTYQRFLESL